MASDFKRAHRVRNGVSIEDVTGVISGAVDPSVTAPMPHVPVSTLYLRTSPPQVWQKTDVGDTDYVMLEAGDGGCSCTPSPDIFLPLILRNGVDIAELPLNTSSQIPLILRNGTEISVMLGI